MDSDLEDRELVAITFIEECLAKKLQGDSTDYDFLIEQLEQAQPAAIKRWLSALGRCVSVITEHFPELMKAVLALKWEDNAEIARNFRDFLCGLVSSHACHIECILDALIQRLGVSEDEDMGEDSGGAQEDIDLNFDTVHNVIAQVLTIVPTASGIVLSALVSHFPHKRHRVHSQRVFLMNMLRAMVYVPGIRAPALAAIVNRLVDIDVEIQIEPEDEEDNWSDEEGDEQFQMEDGIDTQFEMDGQDEGGGRTAQEDGGDDTAMDVMAEKLDNMLLLVYHYLREVCKDMQVAQEVFEALLQIFDRYILPTHRLKYTQFILFYCTSLQEAFPNQFLAHLCQKLANPSEPTRTHEACASYIGSYVARCNHLSKEQMTGALQFLGTQAQQYLAEVEPSQCFPDAQMHTLFYTLCQSILYALCYKRDLLCGAGDCSLSSTLRLDAILHCPLKPLKFLLESVVREFAKIASQVGVQDYDQVVEENSQHALPSRAVYGGENTIELFFPFDPYLLRFSSMFISRLYQEWNQGELPSNDSKGYGSDNDYDSVGGLSITGSMPSPSGLGMGLSMDIRSLSATLDQDLPVLSMSPGSAHSPGFQHIVKRQKRGTF